MGSVLNIADGIRVIDTGYIRKEMAAIYLVRQGNEIAIIETGTKHSIPNIQQALEKDGLNFSSVAYIIPTHVHLDHAAGAGELMKLCPNAQLVIHPRGARHMVDPNKLIAGTVAVYGQEKFNQLYGDIVPIDSSRIIEADDNFVLDFNGRELKFIDTPGHAKHHFCVWDKMTESMFTGDTFGISYRDFDNGDEVYIFPTTTPTQFDPEELISSIKKLMKYKPKRICLTHFGAIKPTKKVIEQLIDGINFMSSLAIEYAAQDNADEKVAMIDEGDNALRAARGNFGLIWVQGKGEKNSSYADLTLQSAKKWPRFNNELMALTKIDIGFEQKGGFDFCLNQEEFDERIIVLKHIAENSHEQFSYEMFNHEELAKKLPKIGPEVVGASYSSWDGHVNPLLLLRSLHKGFQELGGKLLTHSVSDIKYNDSYFSVQAKNGVINSNKVILAAGFSNQNLAPKIGLKMSLFPQRGQILVTEKIKPFLDYPTGLIRQTNEGGLLLGDSHEDVGFDDGTNLQTMQQIAQRVTTIFPFLRDVKMIRAWGSLRILTDDRLPIYDYSKTCPGAYTVSSHSGVTLAAIHALDIASHIVKDGKLPISLNCFSAERFDD